MSTVLAVTSPSLNDAEEFVPPGLESFNHDTSTGGLSSATLKYVADDGVSADFFPPILEAQGS